MRNETGLTVIAGTLVLDVESVCFQTLGKAWRNRCLALLIQNLCISVLECEGHRNLGNRGMHFFKK